MTHEQTTLDRLIADIEELRSDEGATVEVVCDDPEAYHIDMQSAVIACGAFTDWQPEWFNARTWIEALAKAADASRAFRNRKKPASAEVEGEK